MAITPQREDAMFTLNESAHVALAKKVMESDLHLAWGTISSRDQQWEIPPLPNASDTRLIQEVGRRLVVIKKYVVPNTEGEIKTSNGSWSESKTPTRTIFIQVNHELTDASDSTIYQLGLFIDTKATPGNQTKQWLLPDEVKDQGQLLTMANIKPIERNSATREVRQLVLNF